MRIFLMLAAMLIACLYQQAYSQTCPPNLDFETSTFDNWQCSKGYTNLGTGGVNQIVLTASAPEAGRHEIIRKTSPLTLDPYGKFPQLCPYGGNTSVKLGNDITGSEAEGISYTFTIPQTEDTFSFTYYYAVVFEDPNHAIDEQPRFFVTAYDVVSGEVINCASYNYVSNGSIPGFEVSPVNSSVLFKNWSPSSIQFASLAGRTVRLEFKTADCTLGGHFGYAYLDVGTGCSNILATAPYCIETNSLILNAPYGFQTYTWYNENYTAIVGNQQSITLSPPPVTAGTFHVDVIPYPGYGCRDTVDAVVTPLPVPDTPVAPIFTICQGQTAGKLTATASPDCYLLWYTSASGGVGSTQAPVPSTVSQGTFYYYVSQKGLFGCESFRKRVTVNVLPTPQTSFTINQARQCLNGNKFTFTSTSTNLQNALYHWDFGDGNTLDSSTAATVNYVYTTAGNYQVTLKVVNSAACSTSRSLNVVVVPKPVADFDYPSLICQQTTSITFSNNSSVPNGSSVITGHWWNMNGNISTLHTPTPYISANAGEVPVKLVVTTQEGCRSDTTVKLMPVRHSPTALFTHKTILCENDALRFMDASTMAANASPEYIKIWNWQIDNASYQTRNVQLFLSPGSHQVSLIAESDYGCRSAVFSKNLIVNPKPVVQLTMSDSCVRRSIAFNATDPNTASTKWLWDFGNGLMNRPAVQYKTFNRDGNYPLTLVAENNFGCRDTLSKLYTIFENHAFAGRDTVVAMDEPVQLNANGEDGCIYLWTPSIGLNNNTIENPIALYEKDQLYYLDALTKEGCDSRTKINIRRYKGPELYIPNTFTPNNDGLNDVLKVLPAGIRSFEFFAVYNRLGQQIFYTKDFNKGWNGTFKGNPQDPGAYVVVAKAVDYKGKPMLKKLSVLLMR
ncbi:MAG: PKD domain-containing protein [Sphingobacteriaceae bacterium]|nr:MAG: PKD domain-containing protein [Sphingobacteriaceae bacterium]